MKISVTVKPQSKLNSIQKMPDGGFLVRVTASPVDGKANEAVMALLAEYFKVPKTKVNLLRGQKSKIKLFEVSK